jgi:putative tryptophan/tyrosine transport system substrate-binding protein
VERREFITLLSGATITWPLAARAQQPAMLRVGVVTIQPRTSPPYAALDQRLHELGYIEGQNLAVDFLNPETLVDGVGEAVRELIRRKADVIVAPTETVLRSALAASNTLPIVMIAIDYDPFAMGYLKSLARPGRNATGLFSQQNELAVKRLELLKDALPNVRAATVFWDAPSVAQWKATEGAAATLGLQLVGIELREQPYDYERALAQAAFDHRGALIVSISSIFYRDRRRLAELALRHRIPSMFVLRESVEAGGLLSYGANFPTMFRRVAEFVDKIARGAKPADLPIEQPTKFDFIINLKAAKAIGIELPTSTLLRADEVIE